MRTKALFIYLLPLGALFSACEDVVKVDVTPADAQLVVDAFITNRDTLQTIRLTQSVPYFYEGSIPVVTGATVVLTNRTTGREFVFTDTQNDGIYAWRPQNKEGIGNIGNAFLLTVRYQNESFVAESVLNRTTAVDSITYQEREAGPGQAKAGYYATFFGTDAPGQKDYYWIRAYKNGKFQTRILNFAADGLGNDSNGGDGLAFIPPLQDITDSQNPYQLNDTIRVEIWSVTRDTYNFLQQAQTQISNGGLFATTPENVRTNLKNANPASKVKAAGWFSISTMLGDEVVIK